MSNVAYIDGQNLYINTTRSETPWKIDCVKFRRYLLEKYRVSEAYYFVGAYEESMEKLYDGLRNAGFILVFRPHTEEMASSKKGNVDTDLVFNTMKDLYLGNLNDRQVVIVSGDGDYIRMVEFLAEIKKLRKVLLPNQKHSLQLYKNIESGYRTRLDLPDVKRKISLEGWTRHK